MKLAIIIPAYNEERRIGPTLDAYSTFFSKISDLSTHFIVVLNGCKDNTRSVVIAQQQKMPTITMLDLVEGGKGLAIKAGFMAALKSDYDLIGFVDADMATKPQYFYDLVTQLGSADGIIASRYMPGAQVTPARPWIKRWGSRLVYEPLISLLFGLHFYDYQCGAKLFRRKVIQRITPYLSVRQWAFDLELLYLCKRFGFTIKEVPTIWFDQADSKLNIMKSGLPMLRALFTIRWQHRNW